MGELAKTLNQLIDPQPAARTLPAMKPADPIPAKVGLGVTKGAAASASHSKHDRANQGARLYGVREERHAGDAVMDRTTWLEKRSHGIGASDVAAVLGISPWCSPLELYLRKRGELPPQPDAPQMRRGRRLEPIVLEFYEEETARPVSRRQEHIVGTEPWMMATLDGFDSEAYAPVEAKTVNAFAAQEFGDAWSDDVPLAYAAQCHWQVMLTGADRGYLAALIGSDDFRIFELRRDRDLEQMLVARAREFWQRVQDGKPPEPISDADVCLLYRRDAGTSIAADDEIIDAVAQLASYKASIKEWEETAEGLATKIKAYMGEHSTLLGPEGKPLATWKKAKDSKVFDASSLKAQMSDIYNQFVIDKQGSRRLLLR